MIKLLRSIGLAACFIGINAVAQDVETDRQSARPILANLDSLTYTLHANGFLNNATYLSYTELDFEPKSELPYASAKTIQQRMNALESEIPLVYNSHVKGFIDLYGHRKKELTSKILTLSDYYFPIFEEVMDKNDIPLEMKYLAVVESALNPRAYSWAGASGLWQFIYSTGLRYGLEINSYVDERRDVHKATQAACDYFKDSYALYGDWLLVIASYNCGPGNVNKAIRRAGGVKDFWVIQKYLPAETRGYVPAFIAVVYVMNYHKEHGIYPKDIEIQKVVEAVNVDSRVTFEQLANVLNINYDDLYNLNAQYKKEVVPGNGNAVVYLPYHHAMQLARIKDSIQYIPLYDQHGRPYKVELSVTASRHKVKKGETLQSIANRYKIAPADIKEWNVVRNNRVVPGQYLTLYIEQKQIVYLDGEEQATPETDNKVATKTENVPAATTAKYHQVQPGDTLYGICKKYEGLTIDKLRALNNLSPNDVIKPGAKLKVFEGS